MELTSVDVEAGQLPIPAPELERADVAPFGAELREGTAPAEQQACKKTLREAYGILTIYGKEGADIHA